MTIKYDDNGLVPAIIQHALSNQVLMLGYMNEEAVSLTKRSRKVTFFSRSKKRIWVKGETSGNFLMFKSMEADCDQDALLIKALPKGPTCHKGSFSCFSPEETKGYLYKLEQTIDDRIERGDEDSYTSSLFSKGINKIAQKVGEEAVELVIEAKDARDDLFKGEAADLLYHFLILLKYKDMKLQEIEKTLIQRRKQ